jgi:signal transduction histidine kinase
MGGPFIVRVLRLPVNFVDARDGSTLRIGRCRGRPPLVAEVSRGYDLCLTPREARTGNVGRVNRTMLLNLAIDFAAPVILTLVAAHELAYNHVTVLTWLIAIVMIWSLAFRRRSPLVVFASCVVLVGALAALGVASVADVALLVALYSVAAHSKFRWAVVCAVIVEAGVLLIGPQFAPSGSADDADVLLTGVVAAALILGSTLRGRRTYLASVEDRAERLELEQAQQAELAALAERARIAREMHDIVAHSLSVVITLSEGAAATVATDPDRAREVMQEVAAGGRQSLSEMRRLLDVLRADDEVARIPQPTLGSLEGLVEDVRRTGLGIELKVTGDASGVSEATQATLYRIVQESLTNIIKHAREASEVAVALDFRPTGARFTIQDDGAPVRRLDRTLASSGNGLRGMRERVAIFDGTLEAGPTESGWDVRGELRLI